MPPSREVLLEKSKGIDGILCLLTDKIDGEFMDNAGPQLKVISQIAVGYNNIDIAEATKRGIPVGYTPDVLTHATADFAFTLLMAAARLVIPGHISAHDGSWKTWHPLHFLGQDIYGSKIGIVGMGRIGFEMAKRSTGFDMDILYYDVNRREDLEKKLKEAKTPEDKEYYEKELKSFKKFRKYHDTYVVGRDEKGRTYIDFFMHMHFC